MRERLVVRWMDIVKRVQSLDVRWNRTSLGDAVLSAGKRVSSVWGFTPARDVVARRCLGEARLEEKLIKRFKGVWWMPWCQEAMKDVVRCEKLRGAANGR